MSGFSSLTYEVIWTRWLGLIVGNFSTAVVTIICLFMLGLAIGNALGGLAAKRLSQKASIVIYGVIEFIVGILAILLAVAHVADVSVFARAAAIDDPVIRAGVCSLIFLPQTVLMGATLPIILQSFSGFSSNEFGNLYAVNTIGGALGPLMAAFILIPRFGLRTSVEIGAVMNVVCGLTAVVIAKCADIGSAKTEPHSPTQDESVGSWLTSPYVLGALTGFLSLSFEISLTRLVVLLITGASVYGFALILSAYLSGLGIGSLLARRFQSSSRKSVYGTIGIAMAAIWLISLTTPLWSSLPSLLSGFWERFPSFASVNILNGCVVFALLLIFTIAFGLTLPLIALTIVDSDSKKAGVLVASNTIGGVLGVGLTGYFLICFMGLDACFRVLGLSCGFLALTLVWIASNRWNLIFLATPFLAAITFALPASNPETINAGLHYRPEKTITGKIIYQKDSYTGRIAVLRQEDGRLSFLSNGKPDGSIGIGDMYTQVGSAHIGALCHPHPKTVLIIGLGTGISAGSLALHREIDQVDVIEIEPAQIDVARIFSPHNYSVLANPKVHIYLDDARHYLAATRQTYDVIISEPSNLFVSGMVNLYTEEFYELAKKRLNVGGIFLQWVHYYHSRPNDIRGELKTFQSAFASATYWLHQYGDSFMIGSDAPWSIDPSRWNVRNTDLQIMFDLKRLQLDPPEKLLGWYLWGSDDIKRYAANGRICTDNDPYLEFSKISPFEDRNQTIQTQMEMMTYGPVEPMPLAQVSVDMRLRLARQFLSHGSTARLQAECLSVLKQVPSNGEAKRLLDAGARIEESLRRTGPQMGGLVIE